MHDDLVKGLIGSLIVQTVAKVSKMFEALAKALEPAWALRLKTAVTKESWGGCWHISDDNGCSVCTRNWKVWFRKKGLFSLGEQGVWLQKSRWLNVPITCLFHGKNKEQKRANSTE